MDGLHAAFSAGWWSAVSARACLRHAGAHPSWILAGVAVVGASAAFVNRGPYPEPAPRQRRARLERPLLVVGLVLALAFLVENGLEAWSALFLERTLNSGPAVSGLGPGLFAGAMADGTRPRAEGRLAVGAGPHALRRPRLPRPGSRSPPPAQHAAVALAGFVIAGEGWPSRRRRSSAWPAGSAARGPRGRRSRPWRSSAISGFVAGPALIGAVSGASSLRGGFLFLCAVAVVLAACAPILRRVVGETGG